MISRTGRRVVGPYPPRRGHPSGTTAQGVTLVGNARVRRGWGRGRGGGGGGGGAGPAGRGARERVRPRGKDGAVEGGPAHAEWPRAAVEAGPHDHRCVLEVVGLPLHRREHPGGLQIVARLTAG